MWRSFRRLFLFAMFAVSLQSCLTSGRDFPSRLEWIQKERTKKEDVTLVLGQPYSVGNSDGTPTWTYAFYKYTLFSQTFYKELRFYWNDQNIVKSFTFNSSFPQDLPPDTRRTK